MTITEIKSALDVCDKMIDTLYRRLIPTENLLGGVSDAYERMSDDEKTAYKNMREQHQNLLAYRASLLNAAMNTMAAFTTPDPVLSTNGFTF